MAISSFTHTIGTPGVGTGSALRGALSAGLSVNWTTHPLVTFDGGGANERTYFVLEHVSGGAVLVGVGEGATCAASTVFHSSWLQGYQEFTSVTQPLLFSVDLDGGSGGGSFVDELYVTGSDPGTTTFWNAVTRKLPGYTLADFKTGSTGMALCFSEDVDTNFMALIAIGKTTVAGRDFTRHVLGLGAMSEAPEHPYLYNNNMIVSSEGEPDASGNDVLDFRISYIDDSDSVVNSTTGWLLGTGDNDPSANWTASNDPQADGSTLTQTIPLNELGRATPGDDGRLKKAYFRATRAAKTVTTMYSTSNFYQVQDAFLVAINATDVPSF